LDTIVFDLDGTLANITHRLHFIKNDAKDWDGFFKAIPQDQPISELVDLAVTLLTLNEKQIVFVTGRPERTRKDTISWLERNGIKTDFQRNLFMRHDGDKRSDSIVKKIILNNMRAIGFRPVLVFDDRQSVVDMWREEGIRVAQVAPGNF